MLACVKQLKCEVFTDGQILGRLYTYTEVKTNKQTVWHTFCKSSYYFIVKRQTDCGKVRQKNKRIMV